MKDVDTINNTFQSDLLRRILFDLFLIDFFYTVIVRRRGFVSIAGKMDSWVSRMIKSYPLSVRTVDKIK